MPAAPEHPAVEAWTPEPPPPPQRSVGPGLVASLIALLLVFGMIGLVAARQHGAAVSGSGSPEAAASGLLAALDRDPLDAAALDRAARYLSGEERLLVTTYADRAARLAAGPRAAGSDPLGIVGFGARDIRFKRVGGSDDVAVLEALSGTVRLRSGGAGLELSLDEARQRLAEATNSRVTSLRVVTVRTGGRWFVALLPTALEWSRLATTGGTADYARLTAAPTPGASSPEAAARALLATAGQPVAQVAAQLAPAERNAVAAYLPALSPLLEGLTGDLPLGRPPRAAPFSPSNRLHPPGPAAAPVVTGTERVADGVVKVNFGGDLSGSLIAIRQGGTWYPSMVFTSLDVTLAEQEHS
jgi:hypothetical protein